MNPYESPIIVAELSERQPRKLSFTPLLLALGVVAAIAMYATVGLVAAAAIVTIFP